MKYFIDCDVVSIIIEDVFIMPFELDIRLEKFYCDHLKTANDLLYITNGSIKYQCRLFEKKSITPEPFYVYRTLRGSFPKPMTHAEIRNK